MFCLPARAGVSRRVTTWQTTATLHGLSQLGDVHPAPLSRLEACRSGGFVRSEHARLGVSEV